MNPSPEQFEQLIKTITDSVHHLVQIMGIGIGVLTIVLAAALSAVFYAWSKRIDKAQVEAGQAKLSVNELAKSVADSATYCAEVRAKCRENMVTTFVPRKGVKAMDDQVKDMVGQQLESLKEMIADNKKTLVDKLDELSGHLEKFEEEMWNALHGHRHTDDGAVIRQGNPKK